MNRASLQSVTLVAAAVVLAGAAWSIHSFSSSASAASVAQEQLPVKRVVVPEGGRAGGMLTPGLMIGNTLYLSGQLGTRASADGIEGETKAAIENARGILKAANMDLPDVVAVTAYLVDVADFQKFNSAYTSLFTTMPRPTRTTVIVKELVSNAKVELTMTAVKARPE